MNLARPKQPMKERFDDRTNRVDCDKQTRPIAKHLIRSVLLLEKDERIAFYAGAGKSGA